MAPVGTNTDMSCRWNTVAFDDLSNNELYQIMRLRQDIFIIEQNCFYSDLDGLDQTARHMLAWEDGALLAYLRALPPGCSYPQSSLGRIAVADLARGRQLGRELVQRGITHNLQHWPGSDIQIGAQAHLSQFYSSLGFKTVGQEYIEDGIPHCHMLFRA